MRCLVHHVASILCSFFDGDSFANSGRQMRSSAPPSTSNVPAGPLGVVTAANHQLDASTSIASPSTSLQCTDLTPSCLLARFPVAVAILALAAIAVLALLLVFALIIRTFPLALLALATVANHRHLTLEETGQDVSCFAYPHFQRIHATPLVQGRLTERCLQWFKRMMVATRTASLMSSPLDTSHAILI